LEHEAIAITAVEVDPAACEDGTLVVGPATGGVVGGMAPGTVYLYVFER
jgi:hypothetical protein